MYFTTRLPWCSREYVTSTLTFYYVGETFLKTVKVWLGYWVFKVRINKWELFTFVSRCFSHSILTRIVEISIMVLNSCWSVRVVILLSICSILYKCVTFDESFFTYLSLCKLSDLIKVFCDTTHFSWIVFLTHWTLRRRRSSRSRSIWLNTTCFSLVTNGDPYPRP